MENRQLNVHLTELSPFSIVQLDGMMTDQYLKNLLHVANRVIDGHDQPYIILDLSRIISIDSNGVGAMIYLKKACQRKTGELVVVSADNPNVIRSLYQSTLAKYISFFDDLTTAADKTAEKLGLPKPNFSLPNTNPDRP